MPIHAAIRQYGINNFDFEVLEIIDTEDWDIVNAAEKKWIQDKKSMAPNGYNLTCGGEARQGQNRSKLSDEVIQSIIDDLKAKKYIPDLAEKYQLSRSYLSDINNGRCLRRLNETYPLQQNRTTEEEYYQIIDLIKNTTWSLREIARYMNRNHDTIEKINKGHQKIVRALYDGEFPIRENARQGYTLKPVETISGQTESRVTIDT